MRRRGGARLGDDDFCVSFSRKGPSAKKRVNQEVSSLGLRKYPPSTEILRWSCDFCFQDFNNYDDAKTHEVLCRFRERQRENFGSFEQRESLSSRRDDSFKRNQDLPESIDVQMPTNKRDDLHRKEKLVKGKGKEKWVCDKCKIAKFESYVDAFVHEKFCEGRIDESLMKQLQRGEKWGVKAKQERRYASIKNFVDSSRAIFPSQGISRSPVARRDISLGETTDVIKNLCKICKEVCHDDYHSASVYETSCRGCKR